MAETTLTVEARVLGAENMAEVVAEIGAIFDADAPYELDGTPPDPVTVRQDWYHTKAKHQWQQRGARIVELEAELAEVEDWQAIAVEWRRLTESVS